MSNKEKIIELIRKNDQMSVNRLSDELEISLSMVHRHIKQLLEGDILKKIGSAPHVFYTLMQEEKTKDFHFIESVQKIIDKNFLFISSRGEKINGSKGFVLWCEKRGFDVSEKVKEYIQVYNKYEKIKDEGVISGSEKMHKSFGNRLCLEDVFYADFYAWEIFGKTKLGQLLLYSKQSQDKKMIKEVVEKIKLIVDKLIKSKKIDAIGFIPPTVKRQVQFMKMLEKYLNLSLPIVDIIKVQTDIVTPQKTLNKLQDRIENADNTIFVKNGGSYENVLLIDDAVGSGATLNQVACKVKKGKVAKRVYGFAITGSVKGFDVISEV